MNSIVFLEVNVGAIFPAFFLHSLYTYTFPDWLESLQGLARVAIDVFVSLFVVRCYCI